MTRYQRLNPLACGVSAAVTELVFVLVVGWPMMGMSGMMNGYGMMGRGYGLGVAWWLGGAVVAAFAGAFFAWMYNLTNR